MAVLLARQTAQLSLPESKEDNAARGAATVLKTDVYPCTLMQEMSKIIFAFQMHISCSSMQNKIEIIIRRIAIHDDERIIVLGRCTGA